MELELSKQELGNPIPVDERDYEIAELEVRVAELEAQLKTAHFAVIELSRAYSDWAWQVSADAEVVISSLIEAIESGDTFSRWRCR